MILIQERFMQLVKEFEEKLGRKLTNEEIQLLYTVLHDKQT